MKPTYYTSDIKNPYCGKGKFLWKNNNDETLGKEKSIHDMSDEEYEKFEEAQERNRTERRSNMLKRGGRLPL